MRVNLLFFGVLKDLFADAESNLELPHAANVAALLEILRRQTSNPGMDERVWSTLAVAVNREYAPAAHILQEGDEVALLPPVSGGAL